MEKEECSQKEIIFIPLKDEEDEEIDELSFLPQDDIEQDIPALDLAIEKLPPAEKEAIKKDLRNEQLNIAERKAKSRAIPKLKDFLS